MKQDPSQKYEIATLGGGCFWCLEAIYEQIKGVEQVISGYSGGHISNPSYEQVCTGRTGHAEVVQIHYDPKVINYREMLEVFFSIHNPTTLNRQGTDVGPQYRSIILYHNEEQKDIAEQVIKELEYSEIWQDPIVTELEQLEVFYQAEDYHQEYYQRNPNQSYCQVVISPKVAKFRQRFLDKLK
ncbi:MAG: peptide-methionine (S)-S-oxide reductase MsrA [Anaerolineales bacterium]|jgi:peptide-methionine (S)-S-oxide reductase